MWFVQQRDKVVGPLSVAQLKKNAAAGRIKSTTRLRLGEDGEWVLAESVKGLLPTAESSSPAVQTSAPSRPPPRGNLSDDRSDNEVPDVGPTLSSSNSSARTNRDAPVWMFLAKNVSKIAIVFVLIAICGFIMRYIANRSAYADEKEKLKEDIITVAFEVAFNGNVSRDGAVNKEKVARAIRWDSEKFEFVDSFWDTETPRRLPFRFQLIQESDADPSQPYLIAAGYYEREHEGADYKIVEVECFGRAMIKRKRFRCKWTSSVDDGFRTEAISPKLGRDL